MPKFPFGKLGGALTDRSSVSFRNIRGGIITAQELVVAGGTNGTIRSQNFSESSELGWGVFGDGSAFFYGDVTIGENAVVFGDVLGSWDGADPVDLSSIDTTATTGFALDSSVGTGQFMNSLFAAGIGFMDVQNSNTQVGAIGGSNDELLINGVGSKTVRIQTLTGGTIELDPGSGGATVLNSDTEIAGDLYLSSGGALTTNNSPVNGDMWIEYRGNDAGAIIGLRKTSGSEIVTAQMEVSSNGFEIAQGQFLLEAHQNASIPDLTWASNNSTGLSWVSSGIFELVGNGSVVARIVGSGTPRFDAPAVENLTTGAAATVNIGAHSNSQMRRSTSALKYKTQVTKKVDYLADIKLTPTKHYRKDDKRWRYGLIADWLADQDPLLGVFDTKTGEVESYDERAVMTVMAAKINRLEKKVAALS